MRRIYVYITCCIAGLIGAGVTLAFGLHPACMLGTIIFIVAIVLSLDFYFRERQEKEEKLYAEMMAKDAALRDFKRKFGIDQTRAEHLYGEGFKQLDDFKDKNIEELMELEDVNPTLAKRIHQKIQEM